MTECTICGNKNKTPIAILSYKDKRHTTRLCKECVFTIKWLMKGGVDCYCCSPTKKERKKYGETND